MLNWFYLKLLIMISTYSGITFRLKCRKELKPEVTYWSNSAVASSCKPEPEPERVRLISELFASELRHEIKPDQQLEAESRTSGVSSSGVCVSLRFSSSLLRIRNMTEVPSSPNSPGVELKSLQLDGCEGQ